MYNMIYIYIYTILYIYTYTPYYIYIYIYIAVDEICCSFCGRPTFDLESCDLSELIGIEFGSHGSAEPRQWCCPHHFALFWGYLWVIYTWHHMAICVSWNTNIDISTHVYTHVCFFGKLPSSCLPIF